MGLEVLNGVPALLNYLIAGSLVCGIADRNILGTFITLSNSIRNFSVIGPRLVYLFLGDYLSFELLVGLGIGYSVLFIVFMQKQFEEFDSLEPEAYFREFWMVMGNEIKGVDSH